MNQNPYDILNIPRNSSVSDVKKAYYKLAKEYHPDKNKHPDAINKFKEINDAYKKITSSSDDQIKIDFPDLFNKFNRIIDGICILKNIISNSNFDITNIIDSTSLSYSDNKIIETPLSLTLEQLHNGGQFNVEYVYKEHIDSIKKTNIINFNNQQIKQEYYEPIYENKSAIYTLNLSNDFNIDNSSVIIIKDIAFKQDLHIKIIELKHPIFKRINNNLHVTLHISLKEALLGFTRNIILLDNSDLQINCISIINPYDPKIIPNKGFKNGSLIINFHIDFPTNYSDDIKKQLSIIL